LDIDISVDKSEGKLVLAKGYSGLSPKTLACIPGVPVWAAHFKLDVYIS
jgi:hypothetical protein